MIVMSAACAACFVVGATFGFAIALLGVKRMLDDRGDDDGEEWW